MSQISTPPATRRHPAEAHPTIPVAPLIVFLLLVVVWCEHALRRPRLPRAITETLLHYRAAEIVDAAATIRGVHRAAH